ncbi:TVP38/TMEM64 family protein [Janibacter cremeus]|uniref:TVP38/TMEM64 family membrane protein n=1 Tax=Janibacter cremeus TaxID=1285192 RepID=A0A852VX39_9MICO|nr:TVP38/TMEM64 family protein [Janibacter cremeus]NYF99223.1 putative membrane protein YdjX (TVP38/TMEM64 family) [Janibacter cremeus]
MGRVAGVKAALLALMLLGVTVLAIVLGPPDIAALRSRVAVAGIWAPVLFVSLYAVLALVPGPKSLLTIAGGALFGLWAGAGLSLAGALVGAVVAFGLGRVLGREAVDRLTRGRVKRVDALLTAHGLSAVLLVRLVPLVPFDAVNYAAGLTGVRVRHYVLGSAIGMVPGCLAYAALGAYGSDPWGLAAALSALVLLIVGGSWWARRLNEPRGEHSSDERAHV